MDQFHNIAGRPLLDPKDTQTQLVYRFHGFPNEANHSRSKNWRPEKGLPEGKASLYVAESWTELSVERLEKTLGPIYKVYCAKKLNSHGTHFVWDPTGEESPFMIKKASTLTPTLSDFYERELRHHKISNFKLLPETEGISVEAVEPIEGKSTFVPRIFNSVRRELAPLPFESNVHKGTQILPLHGFLGSTLVKKLANKAGMGRETWIRTVYLPMMAEYFAKHHFELGFHNMDHTQNLLLEVDWNAAKIAAVIRRDFTDLVSNFFKLALEGRLDDFHEEIGGNRLNGLIIDTGATQFTFEELSTSGVAFGRYNVETVAAFEPDRFKRMQYASIFIKEYIRHAEAYLKRPVTLTAMAKDALEWLAKGNPDAPRLNTQYPNKWQGLSTVFGDVVQSINDEMTQDLITKKSAELRLHAPPEHQRALKEIFARRETAFATPSASEMAYDGLRYEGDSMYPGWTFAYDGNRIYALDKELRLIGVTFDQLHPNEKAKLDSMIPVHSPVRANCAGSYSKLAN